MIRDVIWDFDGTLFDTYPAMVTSFRKALLDSGIEETNENILGNMKISVTCAVDYFKDKYGSKLGDDFIDKFSLYRKSFEPQMAKPFPYAPEICEFVAASGGRNYIITHRGDSTIKFLENYGMLGYFTEIVTKKYGFKRKPDPEAFLYLIEKYKIDKKSSLVIGDRECEILGGKAAGIKVCLYNTNNIDTAEVADFCVDSLLEITDRIS